MDRFVFNFHHEENEGETGVVYFMSVEPKYPDKDKSLDWGMENEWCDIAGTLEEYGVHDVSYSPDSGERMGYHSYEITPADQPIVMQKWHDVLTELGFNPGKIEMLDYECYHARFNMMVPDWDEEKNCLIYREPRCG